MRLSAEQAGGSILIAVEDDGGGINRERVLQVARERGVVGPDQQLSDEQIDQLIFAPGFSTASEVSDISGRGVGHGRRALQHQEDRRLGACEELGRPRHAHDAEACR